MDRVDATASAVGPGQWASAPVQRITVLYDEGCALCRRCRDWLQTQPCLVRVELLAAGSEAARQRYGSLPSLGKELAVVDDRQRAWIGPAAYLVCLWATVRFRSWAYLLARPGVAPLAERFLRFVSNRRRRFSRWFDRDDPQCSRCERSWFWDA